jgi:hypothetical protein
MNIYEKNKMLYSIPESLTLVKKRMQVVSTFDEEDFDNVNGSEVLRCTWNTGEYMVSCKTSYLVINISAKAATQEGWTFGTGSMMSIFRDLIIRSKSGVELCRMNDPKIWNKIKYYYETHIERKDKIQEMGGYVDASDVSTFVGQTYDTAEPPTARKYKLALPLDFISPMFSSVDGSEYLPSQLAEGLTFEFYPASKETIFKTGANPITQYNIHDIKFRLDGVILNDRSLMELQNRCHKAGLEWVCHGVYKQDIKGNPQDVAVQNQINFSVSQALKADTVYQLSNRNALTGTDKCGFGNITRDFQYRSGSDYFPQNRVRDEGDKHLETYIQAVYTHPLTHSSLGDFISLNTIYSANLNLADDLELSGIIVNNSKTLEFLAEGKPQVQEPYVDVSTLLHYVKVIKIMGMNVSVAT